MCINILQMIYMVDTFKDTKSVSLGRTGAGDAWKRRTKMRKRENKTVWVVDDNDNDDVKKRIVFEHAHKEMYERQRHGESERERKM